MLFGILLTGRLDGWLVGGMRNKQKTVAYCIAGSTEVLKGLSEMKFVVKINFFHPVIEGNIFAPIE